MCKITDEIVRRAKHLLRNNSLETIEENYLNRLEFAEKISDRTARELAKKMAQQIRTESRNSYFLAKEIIKEYAKINNSKAKEKKLAYSQAHLTQVL